MTILGMGDDDYGQTMRRPVILCHCGRHEWDVISLPPLSAPWSVFVERTTVPAGVVCENEIPNDLGWV